MRCLSVKKIADMRLSVKSIKRFCQTYGIKKKRFLPEDECSDEAVASCYRPYNKYYGYELLDRCASFLLPESVHMMVFWSNTLERFANPFIGGE